MVRTLSKVACSGQQTGKAMGTHMALSYAKLFMGKFEREFLRIQTALPLVWWRFIDDVFDIRTHGEQQLQMFLWELNHHHTSIKCTANWSTEEVSFLDPRVYIKDGRVERNLYTKPTDKHQYLHMKSCHPRHCKIAILSSQALIFCRICPKRDNLVTWSQELKQHLIKWGYPEQLLDTKFHRQLMDLGKIACCVATVEEKNKVFHWWWRIISTFLLKPPDATKLLCEASNIWMRFFIYQQWSLSDAQKISKICSYTQLWHRVRTRHLATLHAVLAVARPAPLWRRNEKCSDNRGFGKTRQRCHRHLLYRPYNLVRSQSLLYLLTFVSRSRISCLESSVRTACFLFLAYIRHLHCTLNRYLPCVYMYVMINSFSVHGGLWIIEARIIEVGLYWFITVCVCEDRVAHLIYSEPNHFTWF